MQKKSLLLSLFAGLLSLNAAANTNTYVGGTIALQDTMAYPSQYRAWLPGAFIGYGTDFDKDFYLAAELAAQFPATISNNYVNRLDSVRMSPLLSLSILPAMYLIPNAMMFMRFGFVESYYPAPGTWRPGAEGGLGLEVVFTPCWSVRSEYDYAIFRNTSAGTPRMDEFALSFKYIFDV